MGKVLVLRGIYEDMTSTGGFVWPKSGHVAAADWSPEPKCGGGLHGFLWGVGDGSLWCGSHGLVVQVDESAIVRLGDKVKFPAGEVVFFGMRHEAANYVHERVPNGTAVMYSVLTGGVRSTLTGGVRSTLTGGDWSTLTGGDESMLTGGDESMLTGGYGSTLTGGDGSMLTGGVRSTLTGGDWSTLTGGYGSTLTGGYGSTLTGGDGSMLTGRGRSTLTGGVNSILCWRLFDGNRLRLHTFYVGEDGVKANTPYQFTNGQLTGQATLRDLEAQEK